MEKAEEIREQLRELRFPLDARNSMGIPYHIIEEIIKIVGIEDENRDVWDGQTGASSSPSD